MVSNRRAQTVSLYKTLAIFFQQNIHFLHCRSLSSMFWTELDANNGQSKGPLSYVFIFDWSPEFKLTEWWHSFANHCICQLLDARFSPGIQIFNRNEPKPLHSLFQQTKQWTFEILFTKRAREGLTIGET